MRVEERDRRAEELKNQMMNIIPEAEETHENELPFEIPGLETSNVEEEPTPETEEEPVEEPKIEEEPQEEKAEEKKEKKKTDKQVSLFSF